MFKAKLNLNTRYYICARIIKFECLPYFRNILIFLSFTLILGCNNDDVIEIRDNHKSTENCISLVSEFLSTFDIIKDVVTSENIFNPDRLTVLPIGAELVYLDTTFFDGDGMDVLIRFGDLGTSPHGLLCKDNKYRSGAILLSLDQDYLLYNSTLKISLSPDEPFYSGDGDHMTKLIGGIKFQRIGNNRINIKCNDFKFINSEVDILMGADLDIIEVKSSSLNESDHICVGGNVGLKSGLESATFTITSPLQKKSDYDCLRFISNGQIQVNKSSTISDIIVDFDPHQDLGCDRLITITTNGKRVFTHY